MRSLVVAAVSLLGIAGCATTLKTHSDFDRSQDFSGYRTFAWMPAHAMPAPPPQARPASPLNRRRIEQAVESELTARGFHKSAEGDAASFIVTYTVGAQERIDVQSLPAPYAGPWRWGSPYWGGEVDVRAYTEGVLSIDIFDGRTRQPVWHGWGSKPITSHDVEHAAEEIPPAVAAILKDFPPR